MFAELFFHFDLGVERERERGEVLNKGLQKMAPKCIFESNLLIFLDRKSVV